MCYYSRYHLLCHLARWPPSIKSGNIKLQIAERYFAVAFLWRRQQQQHQQQWKWKWILNHIVITAARIIKPSGLRITISHESFFLPPPFSHAVTLAGYKRISRSFLESFPSSSSWQEKITANRRQNKNVKKEMMMAKAPPQTKKKNSTHTQKKEKFSFPVGIFILFYFILFYFAFNRFGGHLESHFGRYSLRRLFMRTFPMLVWVKKKLERDI